jgi:glycosyltransferase involved in cell wall biosynthesis
VRGGARRGIGNPEFTNEYPPNVYGGAGVHVEYLSRELARLDGGGHAVDVFSFGEQREEHGNLRVRGVSPDIAFEARDPRHGGCWTRWSGTWPWSAWWTRRTSCTATRGTRTWPAAWRRR